MSPERGGSKNARGDEVADVFNRLKCYCLDLLHLLQKPTRTCQSLLEMEDFLRCVPPDTLQPFVDYTLFPLMLLLDAAVLCRSQQNCGSARGFTTARSSWPPHDISDTIAEGALRCLEEVLKKCHLGSVNQMVVLLKKLTSGAMLSPLQASEEFRRGVILCLRALLLMLHHCSLDLCLCKKRTVLPTFILGRSMQNLLLCRALCCAEPEECLLAFFQSKDASPIVGHWLSLLLNTASVEAARGFSGSAKLRDDAFLTLRVLVSKAGTADALAFFLPGVVSHFVRVFHKMKTMISGAAGSLESLEHALRGLSEFLIITFGDEANLKALDMPVEDARFLPSTNMSTQMIVETLRQLPINVAAQQEKMNEKFMLQSVKKESTEDISHLTRSLCVSRTKEWIDETSARVDTFLASTYPQLCVHSAARVRKGLVDSIKGLMLKCGHTLRSSKLMFVECLCVLACDDMPDVSEAAQEFLELAFTRNGNFFTKDEVYEVFKRLVEKLPRLMLGTDEAVALSHAKRLLVVLFYADSHLIIDRFLSSPVSLTQFLDALNLSLGHTSICAGSSNIFTLSRQNPSGPLLSVVELKHAVCSGSDDGTFSCPSEYPQIPSWVVNEGGQKIYEALAGVLRLVGLYIMRDSRNKVSLSTIVDVLLENFRKLIIELRMREYNQESWHTWYARSRVGHLLRQASISTCILNEIIFGASGRCTELVEKMLRKSNELGGSFNSHGDDKNITQMNEVQIGLTDCIGNILHEYLSSEVWGLPTDWRSFKLASDAYTEDPGSYFFRDVIMLHEAVLDGIGTFSVCLRNDFISSGFLHATLYLLLKSLICSSDRVKVATDSVLRKLTTSAGHTTVRQLIVANADYIVDAICLELRHLNVNPSVAEVLTAIFSHIGVAHEILPLVEEPIQILSMELEVLGRQKHPELTIPFLKAVGEILKACVIEASFLPSKADSISTQAKSLLSKVKQEMKTSAFSACKRVVAKESGHCVDEDLQLNQCEELLFELNKLKRYRRSIATITSSCLVVATPILASLNEVACLEALSIVKGGITALAKVEEAYKHEREATEAIGQTVRLCSFQDLQDDDIKDVGVDENRLLPAMNKIWPYLVICVRSRNLLAVMRCLDVVSSVVQICGGDFFIRRFHTDGHHFWKILSKSPFQRSSFSKEEKPILLPYRTSSELQQEPLSEVSTMKVQLAALHMISEISRNKRSSLAFESVLKKVSGLVVGIVCSGVSSLHEASSNALMGLACMDPDLIWLLVADVYYSVRSFPLPTVSDLLEGSELLPPPLSLKDYLFVQYGGEIFGFHVDPASVESIFQKLM